MVAFIPATFTYACFAVTTQFVANAYARVNDVSVRLPPAGVAVLVLVPVFKTGRGASEGVARWVRFPSPAAIHHKYPLAG